MRNKEKNIVGDTRYRLPLFVVPGMPRAGTTFLYHNLQKHPQIFLPFRKEIDFFNDLYRFRGIDWYHSLYKEIKHGQIAGDLSPACWFAPNSIDYIKQYDPNIKVILAVREPAENTYSLFIQKMTSNYDVPKSFQHFLTEGYTSKLTKQGEKVRFNFSSQEYIKKIQAYQKAFGKNLLIYDFRLFRKNNLAVIKLIEDFLGIEQWFNKDNFDALRINESYRRNIKIIDYLLMSESLRDFVGNYIPRLTAMRIRGFIDRISVRTSVKDNTKQTHRPEYIDTAREHLKKACEYYEDLFSKTPAFLGDGSIINVRCDN